MNLKIKLRQRLKKQLHRALPNNEFRLNFQPQIDLKSKRISGFEALLRWENPVRGMVMPDKFIKLAEETGAICAIGRWVLHQSCIHAKNWPEISVAVNVSVVQFRSDDFISTVTSALEFSGIDPERLELEITESMLLNRTAENFAKLRELRKIGVRLVMDDFGTGYSNLGYLREFPFNKIKIDRSFVADLATSDTAGNIVKAFIDLGNSLNMTTCVEGVETIEQVELLQSWQCGVVQGYYYGRPMPPDKTEDFLLNWPVGVR